ncbi:hypothetical protein [Amaricoccus sp.]|nr:hypothetical protein [Amaricoccus sp.]
MTIPKGLIGNAYPAGGASGGSVAAAAQYTVMHGEVTLEAGVPAG